MNRFTINLTCGLLAALVMAAVASSPLAEAAPPVTCNLTNTGVEQVQVLQAAQGRIDFRSQWVAQAACSDPLHPRQGQTASLRQETLVRALGGGEFGGQTRIVIDFTSAGLRADLAGTANGPLACSGGVCLLQLDVQASGTGIRLAGELDLTFDPQGIGTPNMSTKLDFRVSPQSGP